MKKGNKAGKPKKKMQLAKNREQAILAVVIVAILVIKSVYDLSSYFYQQYKDEQMAKASVGKMADSSSELNNMMGSTDPANQMGAGATPPTPASTPQNTQVDANDIYNQTLSLQGKNPQEADSSVNPDAEIDKLDVAMKQAPRKRSGKMKSVAVVESGRSNPFLPAAENYSASSLPNLPLLSPPETLAGDPDAVNVMGTTISGIMYDKYSPSAIINISGSDYLVKKGDTIKRYKVLGITKDQVMVQLGRNVYKAGVGQLLEKSKMNINAVSNLNKKFGGNEVLIGVKKR